MAPLNIAGYDKVKQYGDCDRGFGRRKLCTEGITTDSSRLSKVTARAPVSRMFSGAVGVGLLWKKGRQRNHLLCPAECLWTDTYTTRSTPPAVLNASQR